MSNPVPGSVFSTIAGRQSDADDARLLEAVKRLQDSPDGAEALKTLRIEKFVALQGKPIVILRNAMAKDPEAKK